MNGQGKTVTPNTGALAIHRYFKDGPGWAYHPSFKSRLTQLIVSFGDMLLSSKVMGSDNKKWLRERDGSRTWLWAYMLDDPEWPVCISHPTMMFVTILDHYPGDLESVAILDAAWDVCLKAEWSGADVRLKLPGSASVGIRE